MRENQSGPGCSVAESPNDGPAIKEQAQGMHGVHDFRRTTCGNKLI